LTHYIGTNREDWAQYDTCELVGSADEHLPILVDQGLKDDFLQDQLKTSLLVDAAEKANYPMSIRYQEGYDHSYFFIASFIDEHIKFHLKHLNSSAI